MTIIPAATPGFAPSSQGRDVFEDTKVIRQRVTIAYWSLVQVRIYDICAYWVKLLELKRKR
jgi:hypothetical protein